MGVRGLTSYIAQRAEQYLKPYELHDCNLVIDGDNLACNLYKDVTGSYSAFGGDYDDFYRAVLQFFQVLAECKINAYVLMDGGYEQRKIRTVSKRLRGKIAVIKRINPCASITLFPLHMKEVFVDAVKDSGVPIMRCVFEADDELAALARKLNCPVLSYDSDFYIHNVKYIPLITLTVRVLTKQVKAEAEENRSLRKNEARHVEKRTKANKIVSGMKKATAKPEKKAKLGKCYKYLDCCIYRVAHLCGRGQLSPQKLPLFAALLGNDYIARSAFRNFFSAGMGKAGRSRKLNHQQRRIRVILDWLKGETAETALAKVLSRLKLAQRVSLEAQVAAAISGYSNEICHAYDYFETHYEHVFELLESASDEEAFDEEDDEKGFEKESDEEALNEEGEEELFEEESTEVNKAAIEKNAQDEDVKDQSSTEPQSHDDDDDGDDSEDEAEANEELSDGDKPKKAENNEEEQSEDDDKDNAVEIEDKALLFPPWFLEKLYPASLPRGFVDLLHLRKYINNPQIEHFPHTDANDLALPILNYSFALLHNAKGAETPQPLDEEGQPQPIEYTYLTRAQRVTNVRYYRMPIISPPKYDFVPSAPDARHLRIVFESRMQLDPELLFKRVLLLPQDLQLYFLAIVYWLHKSEHCDLLHLHALLICLVVLRTIDVTIPAEREIKAFQRRFGKIVKLERAVRDKETLEGIKRGIKPALLELPIPERMSHVPKSDCYLVQDRLLPHFHMQEIFKRKYDLYSTHVLHCFAEFQAVVYQLHGLNALLEFPHPSPHMNQLYCGALLYNLYDLLRNRADVLYYVEHFIFPDSKLMYDFYSYLFDWCAEFVPHWKQSNVAQAAAKAVEKKRLKKQRQAARKAASESAAVEPNADLVKDSDVEQEEAFYDLNNKFCALKFG